MNFLITIYFTDSLTDKVCYYCYTYSDALFLRSCLSSTNFTIVIDPLNDNALFEIFNYLHD